MRLPFYPPDAFRLTVAPVCCLLSAAGNCWLYLSGIREMRLYVSGFHVRGVRLPVTHGAPEKACRWRAFRARRLKQVTETAWLLSDRNAHSERGRGISQGAPAILWLECDRTNCQCHRLCKDLSYTCPEPIFSLAGLGLQRPHGCRTRCLLGMIYWLRCTMQLLGDERGSSPMICLRSSRFLSVDHRCCCAQGGPTGRACMAHRVINLAGGPVPGTASGCASAGNG